MERNHLLYAIAELSVVCQARFKEGGSWRGAAEALRRGTCQVAARWDPGDKTLRALCALGATPLAAPDQIGALAKEGASLGLFNDRDSDVLTMAGVIRT